MIVFFRFYLGGEEDPFWEEKYTSVVPPVPRLRDKVGLGKEIYQVTDSPTHYFERPHEVAVIVSPLHLVEEEETSTLPVSAPKVPLDAQGVCLYCGDSECVGGEDCNFYDGTL